MVQSSVETMKSFGIDIARHCINSIVNVTPLTCTLTVKIVNMLCIFYNFKMQQKKKQY